MKEANPVDFAAYHEPALALDEVRHGLILNALAARTRAERRADLSYWTLGAPGNCAIRSGPHAIVLGALDAGQCHRLAEVTVQSDYPGVIGPDMTATWFVERAVQLGARFLEPEPQQIYSLSGKPRHPDASGFARHLTGDDFPLFSSWITAFHEEALPNDPRPQPEDIARIAEDGSFLLWIDAGRPVSMAGIVRRLKNSAAIAFVYTPPEWRGRGYAGSVTAATVERIHAEGRPTACLYTDLRNPIANRCYRRIGFRPICRSLHYHRQKATRTRPPTPPTC